MADLRCVVARCDHPAVRIGFCRAHWRELSEEDVAWYARRYRRLYKHLVRGTVDLAVYHDRSEMLKACWMHLD